MKNAIFCLILAVNFCLAGDDADSLLQTGMTALRAEDNVAAIKAFARASELAEAAGDDAKAVELGGLIYWTKKKLNLAQATALNADAKASQKVEAVVAKKVEPSDADKWLERAQKFVAAHQDDQLRCAITLFEVADRFPMTDAGRKAMAASLAAMGKIKSEPAKVQAKVAPPAKPIQSKGVSIEANPEYAVETMKDGANVFSNQAGASWRPIAEIDGKSYTQVPSGKPDGVKLRFNAMEKVYFLIDPSWAPTRNNTTALRKIGGVLEKPSVFGGVNKHQLWSLIGRPGQIVDFPIQIIIVCDKIVLEKIQ